MINDRPLLTVIIPTYNRAAVLSKCLDALCRQTCAPQTYEIVVCDDGSSDATRATIATLLQSSQQPAVRYLYQQNSGANAARNRGIMEARGSILLLINDDVIATPAMLAEHLKAHERYPDDRVAVLGRVTISPDLPPSRLALLHLDRAYANLDRQRELDWRAFFTCNISVKKSLLMRGGLFEERIRYHEDLELGERLSHSGLRVVYRPEALGYHDHLLVEDEFIGIAVREAKALALWAKKAPHLAPWLAMLGFEPAMSRRRRFKHQLRAIAVNRTTIPFWRLVARRCPSRLLSLSLSIYATIYHVVMRSHLLRERRNA
jgi:glycosyltransferase involved in cell wall biosynthesis